MNHDDRATSRILGAGLLALGCLLMAGCLDLTKISNSNTSTATNNAGQAAAIAGAKVTSVKVTFSRTRLPRSGTVTATAVIEAQCGTESACGGSQLEDLRRGVVWSVSGPASIASTSGITALLAATEDPLPALDAEVTVTATAGGLSGTGTIRVGPAD